ncbi:translation machinery-associated protein 20 [Orbilia ellipsospora]|uniref:Translation machinery-associated protein 20 n=1 Tax=Orbilia ellipsospora TaxID=2528407 RepID=A0AAV9XC78_9PEZI
MFKKPVSASGKTKIKSSVQRNIRQKICEQFPLLAPNIDDVLPKKAQLDLIKAPDKISLYALDNQVLFFQHHDDAIMPHLKVVHKYPQCFPTVQVDRGAIRFILGGAQLMCPGLTSPGAKLPPAEENIPEGTVVVINAEGKENACMVGVLKMSSEDIKRLNKGNGVENCHYLGDGLWKMEEA